jgi:hypothetical protein
LAHGAKLVADFRGKYGPGTGWVVLADPEGNEFCILRSEAEVADCVVDNTARRTCYGAPKRAPSGIAAVVAMGSGNND